MSPEVAISVEEFARRFGVSRSHAYRLCRSGQIPVLRLGQRVLVPTAALDRLIAALTTSPEGDRDEETNT